MNPAIRFEHGPARGGEAATARTGTGSEVTADLLRLMGGNGSDVPLSESAPVVMRRLHAEEPLFHEGARAEAVYVVRAGTFKTFRTAEDGYEQVLGFSGRAEMLGFDAVCMQTHPTSATALEESSVYVILTSDLFMLEQRIPALGRAVQMAISRALSSRAEIAEVMAAVAAEVRLARFLVQTSERMAASGQSHRRFRLRMNRREIASHLGVAHETVSRSFGTLAAWGILRVDNREVEIVDMARLKALSRSTRRQIDEAAPLADGHTAPPATYATTCAAPLRANVRAPRATGVAAH
jgi:CRP/FNR family transcriptional regulator, anaerobic regulatory protein